MGGGSEDKEVEERVVGGRERVRGKVAQGRRWSREGGPAGRRVRSIDGPAEVVQGRRCPRAGCPGEGGQG